MINRVLVILDRWLRFLGPKFSTHKTGRNVGPILSLWWARQLSGFRPMLSYVGSRAALNETLDISLKNCNAKYVAENEWNWGIHPWIPAFNFYGVPSTVSLNLKVIEFLWVKLLIFTNRHTKLCKFFFASQNLVFHFHPAASQTLESNAHRDTSYHR